MKLLLFLGLVVNIAAVSAQDKLPTIKSNKETVRYQIGDRPAPADNWKLSAEAKPDVLEVNLLGGKPQKVTFITDVDSISFNVEKGKKYDFIVQFGSALYYTQIVGKEITPLLVSYRSGSKDVNPTTNGPVLDLEGGGALVYNALQRSIDTTRGCVDCGATVDVVVLTSNPAEKGSMNFALSTLNGVNSVETVVITNSEQANLPEVASLATRAEVIFFDGGDQCDFVYNIRGTRLADAVKEVYKRGGSVGGISAGLAIQGSFVYDGCNAEKQTTSTQVLADPYDKNISFTYDFFNWPDTLNSVTDTHFVKRDRFGRTLGFLARQIQDGKALTAYAIGVDESSSVVVDKDGIASVIGYANAYFITADHKPEICEKGKPLTYSNFKVWKVKPGETYNLRKRPTTGYYTVSVKEGKLDRDPY